MLNLQWQPWNFREKKFWTPKKISDTFPRENRQKIAKNGQKWHFWGLKGELTCVLQVKLTLFYCKMVNFVMALQFSAPKIIFWWKFRPIQVQKMVKIVIFCVFFGSLSVSRVQVWKVFDKFTFIDNSYQFLDRNWPKITTKYYFWCPKLQNHDRIFSNINWDFPKYPP